MAVGMNYQVDTEVHYQAKKTAEFLNMPLKRFLELALLEKAQRHAKEIAEAPPNPYKRRL